MSVISLETKVNSMRPLAVYNSFDGTERWSFVSVLQFATIPLTAQALAASKISPSGPVGNLSFSATFNLFRTDSSREAQYFGADPTPPGNGFQ